MNVQVKQFSTSNNTMDFTCIMYSLNNVCLNILEYNLNFWLQNYFLKKLLNPSFTFVTEEEVYILFHLSIIFIA